MDSWFKHYNHTVSNPLFKTLASEYNYRLTDVVSVYMYLQEEASCAHVRGTLTHLTEKVVETALNLDAGQAEQIIQALHSYRLLLTTQEMAWQQEELDNNHEVQNAELHTSLQQPKSIKALHFPNWDVEQEETVVKKKQRLAQEDAETKAKKQEAKLQREREKAFLQAAPYLEAMERGQASLTQQLNAILNQTQQPASSTSSTSSPNPTTATPKTKTIEQSSIVPVEGTQGQAKTQQTPLSSPRGAESVLSNVASSLGDCLTDFTAPPQQAENQ